MNPVIVYFISGESFYLGCACLLLAIAVSIRKNPGVRIARNTSAWIGLILIVMAAPPFCPVAIGIFLAAFVAWYLLCNLSSRFRVLQAPSGLMLSALTLCALWSGYLHRRLPALTGLQSDHLVVLGDSISAGVDSSVVAWPVVMQKTTGIRVRNLSRPGATVDDGVAMASNISQEDQLVLIELGGNDMLAGTPSANFEKSLRSLLSKLAQPNRTIIMMELPLLPYRIGYGEAQRRLAPEYGVWLVPKRYSCNVISGSKATLDGLHLSNEGSRRMAGLIAHVVAPVLKRY